MRIVTAAVFFAAATWGAEASSFVVIADGGPIQTPSVQVLTDADAPLVAASVLEIGLPDPVKTAALPSGRKAKGDKVPLAGTSLPIVIRGGIEGEAFPRAALPAAAATQGGEETVEAPAPEPETLE